LLEVEIYTFLILLLEIEILSEENLDSCLNLRFCKTKC
jgi:hypothetical protein